MSNSIGGKLGYQLGNRPVETIVAFILAMTLITWFSWKNQSVSLAVVTGFTLGIIADFSFRMMDVSAMAERWLLMAAVVVIGLKFGLAAFAMSIVGWLFFAAIHLCMVRLGNRLLGIHRVDRKIRRLPHVYYPNTRLESTRVVYCTFPIYFGAEVTPMSEHRYN
jgi:hypothetical protein